MQIEILFVWFIKKKKKNSCCILKFVLGDKIFNAAQNPYIVAIFNSAFMLLT